MKQILILVLISLLNFRQVIAIPKNFKIAFIEGWLKGFFQSNDAKALEFCLPKDQFYSYLENTKNHFNEKTVEGYIDGYYGLADPLNRLPEAIALCSPEQKEVSNWLRITNNVINLFNKKQQLANKILSNSFTYQTQITKEVNKAIEAESHKQYQESGQYYGKVAFELIYGVPQVLTINSNQDMNNFVEGWLIGIFNEQEAKAVANCLNTQDAFSRIQPNFELFERKSVDAFIQSLEQMTNLFNNLPSAISQCMYQKPQLFQMVQHIEEIKTFLEDPAELGTAVLTNVYNFGMSIFLQIDNVKSNVESYNFNEAGQSFGKAIELSLFGNKNLVSQNNWVWSNTELFFKGWMIALFQEDIGDNIADCTPIKRASDELMRVYNDFKKNSFISIVQGIDKVLAVVDQLPQAIDECYTQDIPSVQQFKAKIHTMTKLFENPQYLGQIMLNNIMMHGKEVIADITQSVQNMRNQQFLEAGNKFGEAVSILLSQNKRFKIFSIEQTQLSDFLRGWLIGVFKEDAAAEVAECLDQPVVMEHINVAYEYIQDLSVEGFKLAVSELIEILKTVPKAVGECLFVDHREQTTLMTIRLEKIIDIITNPVTLSFTVFTNVIQHGTTIQQDIQNSIVALSNNFWYQAGHNFGAALDKLLFGQVNINSIFQKSSRDESDFIKGWLRGLFDYEPLQSEEDEEHHAKGCQEKEAINEHLNNAMADFGSFTFQGLTMGCGELFAVIKLIPSAIANCFLGKVQDQQRVNTEVDRLSQILSHHDVLVQLLRNNLQIHGLLIIRDISDAVLQIQRGNWQQAGIDLGDAFKLMMQENINQEEQIQTERILQQQQDMKEEEFVSGWLSGFFQEQDVKELLICVNVDNFYIQLSKALKYFQERSVFGFYNGYLELKTIYSSFTQRVDTCLLQYKHISSDIQTKISQLERLMEDPYLLEYTIAENVIKNGVQIALKLYDLEKQITNQNWKQAGNDLGVVCNLLTSIQKERSLIRFDEERDDGVKPFIEGFFVGIFKTDIAAKLSSCIDIYQFNQHLKTALNDFQDMTFDGIKQALHEIEVCFMLLPDSVNRCINQYPNVKEKIKYKVELIISLFKSPEDFTKKLKENFETYGPTILYSLEQCLVYKLQDDQYNAGRLFGQAMEILFEGLPYRRSLQSIKVPDLKQTMQGFLYGFFEVDDLHVEECIDIEKL